MKYVCADPHFDRVGESVLLRPFSTALEMSEYILDGINRKVQRNDILYILGDFAFSFRETAYWRQRIRCQNIFITRGNHDIKLPQLKQIFGEFKAENILETSIRQIHTVLCHYPFMYWDKSHYNSISLYGHVHDQRTETILSLFPEIRSADMGFDAAKRILGDYIPFNEDEIYGLFASQKGHDSIDFYRNFQGEYLKKHEKI